MAALVVLTVGKASAQETSPGEVKTLPVVSVALSVGSTGKDTRRVVYAPPPGWYIRSHRVVSKKTGLASYAVQTVPAGWGWSSGEEVTESRRAKGLLDVSAHTARFGGQAAAETDLAVAGRQQVSASHHALVVDVVAQGEGLFRGGATLELTVLAELVYLGDD